MLLNSAVAVRASIKNFFMKERKQNLSQFRRSSQGFNQIPKPLKLKKYGSLNSAVAAWASILLLNIKTFISLNSAVAARASITIKNYDVNYLSLNSAVAARALIFIMEEIKKLFGLNSTVAARASIRLSM